MTDWSGLNLWLVSNVNIPSANGLACGTTPLPHLSCPRLYSAPRTQAPHLRPPPRPLLELVSVIVVFCAGSNHEGLESVPHYQSQAVVKGQFVQLLVSVTSGNRLYAKVKARLMYTLEFRFSVRPVALLTDSMTRRLEEQIRASPLCLSASI